MESVLSATLDTVRRRRQLAGNNTAITATTATYHNKGENKGRMASGDIRDRTFEFKRTCETAQKQHNAPVRQSTARRKSQFMQSAANIGKEIKETTDRLTKLSELARRRSLFDDPADEIKQLTDIIKKRITHLSAEVNDLKAKGEQNSSTTKQAGQHSTGVVTSLHNTLKKTTAEFMGVVKTRQSNVEKQEARKSQYGAQAVRLESNLFSQAPPVPAPERQGGPYSSGGPTLSDNSQHTMQMQQTTPNSYLLNRAQDVEAVETTIRELGGIFTQLATIVQSQGEMVQRIDDNVEETNQNVEGAQNELMTYLNSISSNRMLIAKIFAVMMLFSAIWVVFFV